MRIPLYQNILDRISDLTARLHKLEAKVYKMDRELHPGPPGNMPSMAGLTTADVPHLKETKGKVPAHLLARSRARQEHLIRRDGIAKAMDKIEVGDIAVKNNKGEVAYYESDDLLCLTLQNGRKLISYILSAEEGTGKYHEGEWIVTIQTVGYMSDTAGFVTNEPFVVQQMSNIAIADVTKCQEINQKPGNFQFEYRGRKYYGY